MQKLIAPDEVFLSNGIPVILQHYEGPVAATYWWVRTGSADESAKEAGFAHFLEHMLFKDAAAKETGRASTGKMAKAIESLGGDINAYTSFDQTVYHVTCAAQHWERVVDAFGTMAKPQRFLKADFEREREVILEELKKNEDSPGRQLFQTLFSTTFKKHPYGRPVIGFTRTLNSAKVTDLEGFYRRNYLSGNMGLVLVGPLADKTGARRKAILRLLEKRFGAAVLPKRAASVRSRTVEPPQRKGSPAVERRGFDVKTPMLSLAFRVPDLSHDDIPALDMIAGILGMGELSRLYQKLFDQTAIATDVTAGLYVPKDPGMLYLEVEVDNVSKVNVAAAELFKEIRRLRDEGPTAEELARIIVNIESERLYATQTADGMAGRLGFLKFIMNDLDFDRKYLEQIHAVDSAKIREAVGKYLVPERMSGALMVPKADGSFETTEISESALELLSAEVHAGKTVLKKSSSRGTEHPVEVIRLPSGVRAVYYERPQSHVFSVHASVMGGLRLELAQPVDSVEQDWGSSYMMALTWSKGTSSKDARAIAHAVEGRAAGLDGFSGRNTAGLQMTGLSRDWGSLSEVFTEVLLDPVFPEREVDHSRRVAEDSIRGIEEHTSQLCSKLFLETLFEKHPYGKMTTGSFESLKAIHSDKLKAFHRSWVRPDRLVLAISGSVKRPALDLWLDALDRQVREYSMKLKPRDMPIALPDEETLKAPRWVEKNLGREQAHILVGGLGTRITAEDRHALRLMQTILGGQSGRLFIELREKKSLAYTVAPVSFEGIERGYAGTYIACSPSKRDEAIAGIRTVLENLAEKGPTPAEMSRAKEFFLGRRAMDLQSDSALSAHYGLETLYGIPLIPEEAFTKTIQAISAKDIKDVCRKYLVTPHMVTSVVG
jgi:zinc protease